MAAYEGLVAPIILRDVAIMLSPSQTMAQTGPDDANSTSLAKNGLPSGSL